MAKELTPPVFIEYCKAVEQKLAREKEYVTALDAATGDGDHWVNIYSGFEALVAMSGELEALPLPDMLKKVGMTLMSKVGGSSGVLYGSMYIAAAKEAAGKDALDGQGVLEMLQAMLDAIQKRGNAQPGQKTMIDALHPAIEALRAKLAEGVSDEDAYAAMKQAAISGAENTKDMEAVRGRAVYQTDKGKGHLDPGAVTMSYQLALLADTLTA